MPDGAVAMRQKGQVLIGGEGKVEYSDSEATGMEPGNLMRAVVYGPCARAIRGPGAKRGAPGVGSLCTRHVGMPMPRVEGLAPAARRLLAGGWCARAAATGTVVGRHWNA